MISGDSIAGMIAYQFDSGSLRSSGYVARNVQVAIIDLDTRKVVGSNVRGEIWCKTPHIHECFKQSKCDSKMDSKFHGLCYIFLNITIIKMT